MWAIGVKFLRGVCVATDSGQWAEAEWPPHPARLHMSLAATYFETCEPDGASDHDQQKRAALEWLEKQGPPRILASAAETRDAVTVFVPVNDSTRADQLFSSARSRQPRYFPTSIPHDDDLFYVWDGEIESNEIAEGLEKVVFNVSRIGHSSSLVQVWLERTFDDRQPELEAKRLNHWTATNDSDLDPKMLRVPTEGSLRSYASSFAVGMGRPQPALSTSYFMLGEPTLNSARSYFDDDLLVLAFDDSPVVGLESTLQLSGAMRKKIHDAFQDRTSPEWLGGHKPDGSPSETAHAAFVPLPFVGSDYADGHLLGMAIVFPREVSKAARADALKNVFEKTDGDWIIRLRLNDFRRLTNPRNGAFEVKLVREVLDRRQALRSESWTRACTIWESVTPIVLDRFPKTDRRDQRQAWNEEVAEIISASCQNIGLPSPGAVHVGHNAFVSGAPKCRPGAGGYPLMPGREGKPSRYQVHARLEFDVPVVGPVVIGAGRFVGYGFCRPNLDRCRQRRGV